MGMFDFNKFQLYNPKFKTKTTDPLLRAVNQMSSSASSLSTPLYKPPLLRATTPVATPATYPVTTPVTTPVTKTPSAVNQMSSSASSLSTPLYKPPRPQDDIPIQGEKTIVPPAPPIDTSGAEYQRMVQIGYQLNKSGTQDPALMDELTAYYQKYAASWRLQGVYNLNSFLSYILENTRTGQGKPEPPPTTEPPAGDIDTSSRDFTNWATANGWRWSPTGIGAAQQGKWYKQFGDEMYGRSLSVNELKALRQQQIGKTLPTDFRVPDANGVMNELRGPDGGFGRPGKTISSMIETLGRGLHDTSGTNDEGFLRQLKQIYDMHKGFWTANGLTTWDDFLTAVYTKYANPPSSVPVDPRTANTGAPNA